jgi:hypothetical protein
MTCMIIIGTYNQKDANEDLSSRIINVKRL